VETQTPTATPQDVSFADLFRDISASAKDLMVEQGGLLKAEFNATLRDVGADLRDLVVFASFMALAVLPLMMFLIFGLGVLLGDRLWLSSLIVTVVWGGGAGLMAYRQYLLLKSKNPTLPATRRLATRGAEALKTSVQEVKNAVETATP